MLNFSRISEDKAGLLERPFEKAEIFGVVMDFDGDKVRGSDGYPMAFFSNLLGHYQNRSFGGFSVFFLIMLNLREV